MPSIGPETAQLLIIGLAPGLKGAHRTGRPFTGDASGDLLFETLGRFGFTRPRDKADLDQHPQLASVMITNAVRCVPPQNKPNAEEINTCRQFLSGRIAALPKLKVLLPLGRIAHESTLRALGLALRDFPFRHGANYQLTHKGRALTLVCSFHCSRYNVNTRRLTPAMFDAVFADVKAILARG